MTLPRRSSVAASVSVLAVLVVSAATTACGASKEGGSSGDGIGDGGAADPERDAEPGPVTGDAEPDSGAGEPEPGWETLLTGEWSMPAGEEGYVCARKTVDHDIYVSGMEAINPLGTHHTLLTMGEPDRPDGIEPCTVADNRPLEVFGSGVGTDRLVFPEGVAVRIPAGVQLNLNLHLFNTTDEPMTGTSGQRVLPMAEADVVDIAEATLAGTVLLDIPAGETTTATGYCTMSADVTLIAVAPHMHQIGIYEKVTAMSSAAGDVVIHDAPYDFDEQSFHILQPTLPMAKGDRVKIECTHQNTTAQRVTFGESSLSEMCFAGLYRYPATGDFFICADDFPIPRPQ